MESPLYEHLIQYINKNRISFAMPGHKNGRGINKDLLSVDVTELSGTENLHNPGKYVQKSRDLLSKLYGSEKSYIITGGSTIAIQAMICSAVKPGGTLLASANCHMSVINTCALVGINIRFIPKSNIEKFAVPAGDCSIEKYITDDVCAVILTSPNYYGICSNIENISSECHKRKIPLLVDEAHGPHFITDDRLPETAVKYADAVCHSAHKTLNALTGSAYLHLNSGYINMELAKRALYAFETSSPSYVIASSADIARAELESENGWGKCIDMCEKYREKLKDAGINVLKNDDITRVVISLYDFGISGFEAEKELSDKNIDIEMADLFNIVLIVTPSNTCEDMEKLFSVLLDLVKGRKKTESNIKIYPPMVCKEKLYPQKAFFSKQEKVDLENCIGRVSCSTVVPYPPGIPVIYTGEKIRKEQIEYIYKIDKAGAEITGIDNGMIYVME